MSKTFVLPDLGEGITEAQIIRLLVKPGEKVAEDQPLMEVETDKAAVEIPSPYAGVAKTIHVQEGQTVSVGSAVVTFDVDGAAPQAAKPAPAAAQPSAASRPAPAAMAPSAPTPAPTSAPMKSTAPAAPAVRKLAREKGLDLDSISGTGPGGRVTREDIESHSSDRKAAPAAAGSSKAPSSGAAPARPISTPTAPPPGVADADKWGSIRRDPINQIRKTIANQMSRSAFTAVHVTHSDEVDITELDKVRRQLSELTNNDPKLTVMTFVIRATCLAVRRHPIFNSSFDLENGQILYKEYVNMGVAVDTDRGLIVPVIRNADRLGLRGIATELRSIADRIRANRFDIEDLRGGTFTITNVGALGGMFSTPIINYPEVAILGLGRSRKVPVYRDDALAPALLLPINLSFDHRATDGANAARFCGEIMSYLENPAKFLLD